MNGATLGMAPSDARESNFGGEGGLTHARGSFWTPRYFPTTAALFWEGGVVITQMYRLVRNRSILSNSDK